MDQWLAASDPVILEPDMDLWIFLLPTKDNKQQNLDIRELNLLEDVVVRMVTNHDITQNKNSGTSKIVAFDDVGIVIAADFLNLLAN
ncbi:hypothetical protein CDAR_368581 [Caerostris darwini]|uniref:Uncharacterized protein n=1 Tax=Caerostris darwini TaxID=1538125 RepID=A0AAV4WZV6_9ARAC|nr:hypothetical protein CDAR_368581 [Caerostris darwini]